MHTITIHYFVFILKQEILMRLKKNVKHKNCINKVYECLNKYGFNHFKYI